MKQLLLLPLLFITVISFGQVPNYVPTDSLVGWWGFNGNANDESVNTNNGTVNGATLTTDRFGTANAAYDFDGVDDFIQASSVISNIDTVSISFWVQLNNDQGGSYIQIGHDGGGFCNGYGLGNGGTDFSNTGLNLYALSSCNGWNNSTYDVTVSSWFNLVFIKENLSGSYYMNGVFLGSQNLITINQPSDSVYFGNAAEVGAFSMNGNLDDIGMWNRALTQCEISALYHSQTLTSPLVDLGADTLSACGSTTILDAGTDPAWDSYLWNTTETTQDISVSNSGLYTIAVTDTNGCIGYDTTLVSIIDPTIDQIDTNICIGDSLVLSMNNCLNLNNNLQNGLVAYYPFCGNANDESGNGNDGNVNGAALTSDRFGNPNSAYSFDGVDDNIKFPIDSSLSFTVSCWINSSSNSTANFPTIFYCYDSLNVTNTNSDYRFYGQLTTAPAVLARLNPTNLNYYDNISTTINQEDWYYLTFIIDNTSKTHYLYIDGQLETSISFASEMQNFNTVIIGTTPNGGEQFNGQLDDYSFYEYALSAAEIQQLYTLGQYDITWSTGDTTSSITVQPATTTTYSVTVDDGISSCTEDVTITVNEVIPVLTDTLSACGATTTLDAGTDPAWASYIWNTTETTQDISVSNSGMYTIAVTDTNGCIGYDTTLVSIIDPTISQIDTNICIGDSLVLSIDTISGNSCIGLPVNLQNGLVAHYPFCGNANDESGNGNDGAVNGASLTTDRFGNTNSAYDFDGNTSHIVVSHNSTISFDLNDEFTVGCWFDIADNTTFNGVLLSKWDGTGVAGNPYPYVLSSGSDASYGGDYFICNVYDGQVISGNTNALNILSNNLNNSWNYGIFKYNNGLLYMYLNGNLIGVDSLPSLSGPINNTFDLQIGRRSGVTINRYFNGQIDDIGIWNRALDSAEIQQLYTHGQCDITWSTGDTTSSITVQPATTTTYSVTVDDGISSCTDDVTITVNDPQVTAGADQTICNGDAITLSGAGASTYTWDNGVTDGVAISPTATADYIVTGTDTLGCVAEDTTTITVNPLPTVDAGIFQQICDGDTVTLSGTGAATYTWDNGQTDGIEFTPSATTLYTVIGTDANGCIDSDTVSIGVWSLPLVDAGADQTICDEDLVTLSGSGASTYSWDNSVVDGVGFSPSATTTYTLTGTDANGCSDLAYVTVTVNPLPAIDAGSAQIVCTGTPVTLSATGAVSYTWNNGVTDGVAFTPTNTLLYEVIGTDANSCEATDTVTVTVVAELTVLAGTDQTVCEGTSVTLSGSGANTYTWTGGVTNAIPFTASSTTIYVVTGSDGNNCADTDSVTVNVNPTPDLSSVTTNVSLGMDGEIDLSVTNGTPPYLYDWDNDGIGDFDDPEDLSTLDAGTYSVIVTDDFGCSDTLMVIITEDLQIFISTVITPNGDGMNDTWGVTGLSTDAKVQVLNRWGQVLYNTTGYATPWDGTNNGETLPASDYYYIIDLGQGDVRTGTITLKY